MESLIISLKESKSSLSSQSSISNKAVATSLLLIYSLMNDAAKDVLNNGKDKSISKEKPKLLANFSK